MWNNASWGLKGLSIRAASTSWYVCKKWDELSEKIDDYHTIVFGAVLELRTMFADFSVSKPINDSSSCFYDGVFTAFLGCTSTLRRGVFLGRYRHFENLLNGIRFFLTAALRSPQEMGQIFRNLLVRRSYVSLWLGISSRILWVVLFRSFTCLQTWHCIKCPSGITHFKT